jgi:C-8 sterol isomerase
LGYSAFNWFVDRPQNTVFDPKMMQEAVVEGRTNGFAAYRAARTAAGPEHAKEFRNESVYLINGVVDAIYARYPKYILKDGPWMFNNAGGAMGSMKVLHASFHEYVIIFGTAVGTEGHSGRFLSDDYFTIIHGEQWAQEAESPVKQVYVPGEQHLMRRHHAKHYRMPGECWALEYAVGDIVSMLPFGIWDTIFSTLDFVTWFKTAKVSAEQMLYFAMMGKI